MMVRCQPKVFSDRTRAQAQLGSAQDKAGFPLAERYCSNIPAPDMTNFFRIPVRWVLPIAVTSLLPFAAAQTFTYTNAGVYTNVAPAGVNKVTFKLWGAGGGGGGFSFLGPTFGGGGAF